ncbi:hypothetical protein F4677DRAFT_441829 [Hypoxylon crocopeplum]|nr:hypothetical protein F4677DRAFT_441829 [Hypoxylon crocopeplum]
MPIIPGKLEVEEVDLSNISEQLLDGIAGWIAKHNRFTVSEQINNSLLQACTTDNTYNYHNNSIEQNIAPIKEALIRDGKSGNVHLLMVTRDHDSRVLGLAWISQWTRTCLDDPVNESFTDPTRDHNDFIDHALRGESSRSINNRKRSFVDTTKQLRNGRLAHLQGTAYQIRDILLHVDGPADDVLAVIIKTAVHWAELSRTIAIATFPRLYLSINHELDRQGFRVIDTTKYEFTHLSTKQMIRASETDLRGGAYPVPRTVKADLMLRVYDKGASSRVMRSLRC